MYVLFKFCVLVLHLQFVSAEGLQNLILGSCFKGFTCEWLTWVNLQVHLLYQTCTCAEQPPSGDYGSHASSRLRRSSAALKILVSVSQSDPEK